MVLLAGLASVGAWAQDNAFYFTDAALMPGETTNIELCLRNTATDLTCLEAEIQLPESLEVVLDDDGTPLVTLYRNRGARHELLANVLDNGNLKLLISSIDANQFAEGEGPILSFCVQAEADAFTGEYQVETVGESLLVNTAANASYSVGVTGNVLITDDPTSINEELRMKNKESGATYNLSGQRVSKAKNGIFIRGGKKIIRK